MVIAKKHSHREPPLDLVLLAETYRTLKKNLRNPHFTPQTREDFDHIVPQNEESVVKRPPKAMFKVGKLKPN